MHKLDRQFPTYLPFINLAYSTKIFSDDRSRDNSRCESFDHRDFSRFQGYYGDGFTCLPHTSCRHDPNLCSADASCVPAGENQFACVCNEGYTGDGANCKRRPKHESNFLLVNQGMATLRIPFVPTQLNPGDPIYIAYTQMAIALDIDCLGGKAYTSDITGNNSSVFG